MLVYDFTFVETPFEGVARWMSGVPVEALAAAVAVAFEYRGPNGRMEYGTVRSRHDALVLDFHWAAPPTAHVPFDRFDGELQCAPLDDRRSHLSVSASCESLDDPITAHRRSSVQRDAEARARRFLSIVAASVPPSGLLP